MGRMNAEDADLFPFSGLHLGDGLIFQDVVFRGTGDGFSPTKVSFTRLQRQQLSLPLYRPSPVPRPARRRKPPRSHSRSLTVQVEA
jgi:hypothetical protein